MIFPANIVQSGKQQLQALWDDSVTVTRKKKIDNVNRFIAIYTDLKCHFSQGSQPALNQTATVATVTSVFTLYVDTSIEIISGDTLIIKHKGQTFKGVAGRPFNRNWSNAVKVEVEEIS